MLQGVLARGTARAAKHLSAYAAGKTGTTDDELDAWFVGFTNDVTVAIWVGYDNADGNRRTLGRGQTGGRVALPMFEPILQSVWALHAPKTALSGPSKEAMRELVAVRVDAYTGDTDEYGEPRLCAGVGRGRHRRIFEARRAPAASPIPGIGSFPAARTMPIGAATVSTRTARRCSSSSSAPPFDRSSEVSSALRQPYYSRRARSLAWLFQDDDNTMRAPRRVDPDYFFGRRQY